MVEGSALLSTMMWGFHGAGVWSQPRGMNFADGGAFYNRSYEAADGKYVTIASRQLTHTRVASTLVPPEWSLLYGLNPLVGGVVGAGYSIIGLLAWDRTFYHLRRRGAGDVPQMKRMRHAGKRQNRNALARCDSQSQQDRTCRREASNHGGGGKNVARSAHRHDHRRAGEATEGRAQTQELANSRLHPPLYTKHRSHTQGMTTKTLPMQ